MYATPHTAKPCIALLAARAVNVQRHQAKDDRSMYAQNNKTFFTIFTPSTYLTLLLNLMAGLVGWYKISLHGLLRLYENPLSTISPTNTTFG